MLYLCLSVCHKAATMSVIVRTKSERRCRRGGDGGSIAVVVKMNTVFFYSISCLISRR